MTVRLPREAGEKKAAGKKKLIKKLINSQLLSMIYCKD
jgi:hypothetical protein